jgi:hypothetical protein
MSTVVSCIYLKDWSSNGKTGKVYDVVLSDGSQGQSFSEIPIGTPKEQLEITPNGNYPNKIKWNKPGKAAGFPVRKENNAAYALSYAKDYACAVIGQGKEFKMDHVITLADKFLKWLNENKA